MPEHWTPRYAIIVDEEACGNAYECLKCVRTCLDHGPNVLGFMNKATPDKEEFVPKTVSDIDHRIVTGFMINCDGCRKCVEVCPNKALTLKSPAPPIPRAKIDIEKDIILCAVLKDGTQVRPD